MGKLIYDKELIKEEKDIKSEVIKFFASNPNPPDSKVHNFAEQLGIDPDVLEGIIYSILSDFIPLKHGDDPDEKYDAEQLKMGIEVEKEHIDNPDVQKMIAKAHLAEFPKYYDALKKMEDSMKKSVNEDRKQAQYEMLKGLEKHLNSLKAELSSPGKDFKDKDAIRKRIKDVQDQIKKVREGEGWK